MKTPIISARRESPRIPLKRSVEAQIQALIQLKADVYLKMSYLSKAEICQAFLITCHSIEGEVERLLKRYGPQATICVLPEGRRPIPYGGRSPSCLNQEALPSGPSRWELNRLGE